MDEDIRVERGIFTLIGQASFFKARADIDFEEYFFDGALHALMILSDDLVMAGNGKPDAVG